MTTNTPPSAAHNDEPSQAELVCAEAYQVVGSLLRELGQFDTEHGRKILDNLNEARLVHTDVLPWPSFAQLSSPMGRCATCRHWDRVKDGEHGALPGTGACKAARPIWQVTEQTDWPDEQLQLLPEHAGLLSMVADGSNYEAELITRAYFGCVQHEAAQG